MSSQAFVIQKLGQLNEEGKLSGIDAIMIGGSVGRKQTDKFSDIDLFLLAEEGQLNMLKNGIRTLADLLGEVKLFTGPIFTANFGYIYTAFYSISFTCQFIVNDRGMLTPNPMNKQESPFIFDKSGYYTDFLRQAGSSVQINASGLFTAAFNRFWLRMLGIWHELKRDNLWLAINFLHECQQQLIILKRVQAGIYPPGNNFHKPAKSVEKDLGDSFSMELSETLCTYSKTSIFAAAVSCAEKSLVISKVFMKDFNKEIAAGEGILEEMRLDMGQG